MGYQYQVGKVHKLPRKQGVEVGMSGFHFCKNAIDVLSFYGPGHGYRYAKVTASGIVREDSNKCTTNTLFIQEELTEDQLLDLCTGTFDYPFTTVSYQRGKLHSFNDVPCVNLKNRVRKAWKKDGILHRENGPCQIEKEESSYGVGWLVDWRVDGQRAREGGPAFVNINDEGCAFAYPDGTCIRFSPAKLSVSTGHVRDNPIKMLTDLEQKDDLFGTYAIIKRLTALPNMQEFIRVVRLYFEEWIKQPVKLETQQVYNL